MLCILFILYYTHTMETSGVIGTVTILRDRTVFYIRVIILFLSRFAYYFLQYFNLIPKLPIPPTISSISDNYIALQTSRFLESYTKYEPSVMNANIEKCFYDPKLHALAVEQADNELEQTWRRRIMMETTPRGNILMYYDAYKQGFSYYSDSSNIPYFVINAAIMKYVLLYRCRDFFLDGQITPEAHPSPLLRKSDKSTADQSDKQSTKQPDIHMNNSKAFAKLKNYNTVSAKTTQSAKPSAENTTKEKQYTRNKVIYSGKIANATLLQKPTIKTSRLIFSSPLLGGLSDNSSAQKQVFNYRDFKRMRETDTLPSSQ